MKILTIVEAYEKFKHIEPIFKLVLEGKKLPMEQEDSFHRTASELYFAIKQEMELRERVPCNCEIYEYCEKCGKHIKEIGNGGNK